VTTNELAAGYYRKCDDRLAALAAASKELRKEREFSFYGDIDFIPTDEYDADDADTAIGQARFATACLARLLRRPA